MVTVAGVAEVSGAAAAAAGEPRPGPGAALALSRLARLDTEPSLRGRPRPLFTMVPGVTAVTGVCCSFLGAECCFNM